MASWSARYRASLSAPRDTVDSVDTVGGVPSVNAACVNSVNSVTGEREADAASERFAIKNEPNLPPPGTDERERLEAAQRCMVAGLLQCARRRHD
jgi:hypothetical protein